MLGPDRTRRFMAARGLLALGLVAAAIVGLLGTVAYLRDYGQHRGFPPIVRIAHAAPGRLVTVHFSSRALGRKADYVIYLPAGYTTARRYAVLFLLHGSPGEPDAFTSIAGLPARLDNLVHQQRAGPMLLVFPDGRLNGDTRSDGEWADTRTAALQRYVLDVVHDVDARFSTFPDRRHRVLGGYSEGGYGALNIALHHPDLFGGVEVWSGYFRQTRSAVFRRASVRVLRENSPQQYIGQLRGALGRPALRVFMYVGRSDPASGQLRPMARALRAAGAAVSDAVYPGGHDWQLWSAHADQMLIVAGQDVGARPAPAAPARGRVARIAPGRRRPRRGTALVVGGLLLALLSAAAINLGFVLQHRGLVALAPDAGVVGRLRSRDWMAGQALGGLGFLVQVAAVAVTVLSLVQVFAAGGLALSVPLASRLLGTRPRRAQTVSAVVTAGCLAVLALGTGRVHETVRAAPLALGTGVVFCAALVAARGSDARLRALAAGLFYGGADVAIKAATLAVHGRTGPLLAWAAVAGVGTLGGFLTLQSALRDGEAVAAVTLMNGVCALAALMCGVSALGESVGSSPAIAVLHLGAVALLLACLPALAAAQCALTADEPGRAGARPS